MNFYSLSKESRKELVEQIGRSVLKDIETSSRTEILRYFSDGDTYIRKAAYQATGKIFRNTRPLRKNILKLLAELFTSENQSVRQTVINAAGEIGMYDFGTVEDLFDRGLFDPHHTVRNAVIGSVKKMGQKNPLPVLKWAEKYLDHEDKEIRREICHGIELRGRTHPQDILPLLKKLQHDKTARVRNTLIHVLGQISYKKGCLQTVTEDLKGWENEALVKAALSEIIDVHERYKDFAFLSPGEAEAYIRAHF